MKESPGYSEQKNSMAQALDGEKLLDNQKQRLSRLERGRDGEASDASVFAFIVSFK